MISDRKYADCHSPHIFFDKNVSKLANKVTNVIEKNFLLK